MTGASAETHSCKIILYSPAIARQQSQIQQRPRAGLLDLRTIEIRALLADIILIGDVGVLLIGVMVHVGNDTSSDVGKYHAACGSASAHLTVEGEVGVISLQAFLDDPNHSVECSR